MSFNKFHRAAPPLGLSMVLPKFCREPQQSLTSCRALQCPRKLQEHEKLTAVTGNIPHLAGKYNPGAPAFTADIQITSCCRTEWGHTNHHHNKILLYKIRLCCALKEELTGSRTWSFLSGPQCHSCKTCRKWYPTPSRQIAVLLYKKPQPNQKNLTKNPAIAAWIYNIPI